MKKYALRSNTWAGTDQYDILEDFDENDFARYENGEMENNELLDYLNIAIEQQNFEWWISEVKEGEEY